MNYYRLTIEGKSSIASEFHFQAGYFSAAAVDILRGQTPDIPEVDLPIERVDLYDRLMKHINGFLVQEANRIAPISDPETKAALLTERVQKVETSLKRHEEAKAEAESSIRQLKNEGQRIEEQIAAIRKTADHNSTQPPQTRSQTNVQTVASTTSELGTKGPATSAGNESPRTNAIPSGTNSLAAGTSSVTNQIGEGVFADQSTSIQRTNSLEVLLRSQQENARKLKSAEETFALHDFWIVRYQAIKTQLLESLQSIPVETFSEGLQLANQATVNEDTFKSLSRLLWLGTISGADIAAIGMNETMNPFQFRKLVFWSTSKQTDLNQIASQADAIADNVAKIGQTYKQIRAQRLAAQEQKRKAAAAYVNALEGLSDQQRTNLKSFLELLSPELAAPNVATPEHP